MALGKITDWFGSLPPLRQKELIRLVLHRAEVSDTHLKLALYGRPPEEAARDGWAGAEGGLPARSPALTFAARQKEATCAREK